MFLIDRKIRIPLTIISLVIILIGLAIIFLPPVFIKAIHRGDVETCDGVITDYHCYLSNSRSNSYTCDLTVDIGGQLVAVSQDGCTFGQYDMGQHVMLYHLNDVYALSRDDVFRPTSHLRTAGLTVSSFGLLVLVIANLTNLRSRGWKNLFS